MAEAHGGGGGGGGGFLALFFGAIFVFWMMSQNGGITAGGNIFKHASSTGYGSSTESISSGSDITFHSSDDTSQPFSSLAVEKELADAYQQVDQLKEEVAETKMWGTLSPYKDQIRLSQGSAGNSTAQEEYLSITAASDLVAPVDITGWRVQSYITGTTATLPLGARIPQAGSINTTSHVLLEPGETALVTTGESPVGISFYENICTGYFTQFQEFYPSLARQCPRPSDEMVRYGDIEVTDDSCYDYVERLTSCERINHIPTDADLSARCERFVTRDLTYQGCVENHRTEPFFYTGSWRLFLSRPHKLWREEREAIKLIDAEGRTVDVVQY